MMKVAFSSYLRPCRVALDPAALYNAHARIFSWVPLGPESMYFLRAVSAGLQCMRTSAKWQATGATARENASTMWCITVCVERRSLLPAAAAYRRSWGGIILSSKKRH